MLAFVTLSLALCNAQPSAPPTTWAELQPTLPQEPKKRVPILLRFARDETALLEERRKAAKEARNIAKDGKRVDAALIEAHLAAVAGKLAQRKEALQAAKAHATKLGLAKEARRLDDALRAEATLAKLTSTISARERAPAKPAAAAAATAALVKPGDAEQKMRDEIDGTLPAWLALGDERQHAAAQLVLARGALVDGDVAGAERAISDVIDALGTSRDNALVKADAWRRLSRIFAEHGARMEEAAAAALAADRALASDPVKMKQTTSAPVAVPANGSAASTGAPAPADYSRSVETTKLCKAARARNVSCAKIEMNRWGSRTYFDFSTEKRALFDGERADDVLAEYESTLHDCLRKGAKANLTTNTSVEIVWSVGNDGRVMRAFDLAPKRLRGTLVETCLGEAFAVWRYPRYSGEMQHVRLTFDVGE